MTKLPCLVVAAAYQCRFAGVLYIHVRNGAEDKDLGLCRSGQNGFVPCDWAVRLCCSSLWCRSQRRGDLNRYYWYPSFWLYFSLETQGLFTYDRHVFCNCYMHNPVRRSFEVVARLRVRAACTCSRQSCKIRVDRVYSKVFSCLVVVFVRGCYNSDWPGGGCGFSCEVIHVASASFPSCVWSDNDSSGSYTVSIKMWKRRSSRRVQMLLYNCIHSFRGMAWIVYGSILSLFRFRS
jgi:hypothetical protein